MDKNRKDEPDREAAKLCFEFFKHFTTVATAVTLVELTLVQLFELGSDLASWAAVMSGTTLLLSIGGMLGLALPAAARDEMPKTGLGTYLLMFFTAFTFLFGIAVFAIAVAVPDPACPFGPPFC